MLEIEKRYLEEWRRSKYWSQAQLAKEAGVNQSVINRIESGKQVGRLDTAKKLADALGVIPEQILDFAPLFGPAKKEHRLTVINPQTVQSNTEARLADLAPAL
jgi:transcriptional regulator with XRE-family HTH domain